MNAAAWAVLGVGAYLAYYVIVWVFYSAWTAWDRQEHAPTAIYPQGVVEGGLARPALYLSRAITLVGLVLNVIGNVGLSLPFAEPPCELRITQRVTRHRERGKGWRKQFAAWIGRTWLDGLDRKGIHRA